MANIVGMWLRDAAKRNRSGVVEFEGKVPLGASGATAAGYVARTMTPGFKLTKVNAKTGRYTVQLVDQAGNAVVYPGDMCGPPVIMIQTASADTAYTNGKAVDAVFRTPASAGTPATDGTFILQLTGTNNADAEAEDNATLWIRFSVKRTTVTP